MRHLLYFILGVLTLFFLPVILCIVGPIYMVYCIGREILDKDFDELQ